MTELFNIYQNGYEKIPNTPILRRMPDMSAPGQWETPVASAGGPRRVPPPHGNGIGALNCPVDSVPSLFEIKIIRHLRLYAIIPAKAGIQSPRTPSHNSHSCPRPSSRPSANGAVLLAGDDVEAGRFHGDSGFLLSPE